MQTFLPDPDFDQSAAYLDRARLQKQIVETFQIMKALTVPGYGWQNHPAVRMWRGHRHALLRYQRACVREWGRRVFTSLLDMGDKTAALMQLAADRGEVFYIGDPEWLGDERVHASHRSNLLRKDPEAYGAIGWSEPADLPYIWPVGRAGTLIYYSGHEPRGKAA